METITNKESGVSICTKGWNWGTYKLSNNQMEFAVEDQKAFGIKYSQIALTSANGKNEVALELQDDTDQNKQQNPKVDSLCEIRFHVPSNELDVYEEEKKKQREAQRKEKQEESKKEGKEGKEDESEEEDQEEDQEEDHVTAANLLNDKIIRAAGIGQFSGEMVTSVQDLPMLVPRGKYSFDFYSKFAKLHGKTHDYKIMFKDINRIFLLQKPDGVHMCYLLQLDQPLRQGSTLHHFIAMHFELERQVKVKLNLTPEQISKKYDNKLQPEMEGTLYDVLTTLFKHLVGIKKIFVPGEFQSSKGSKAVKCSVKAGEGYLFPLNSSIVFIHKPLLYIKHSEIKYIEFSRIGGGGALSGKSFDVSLTKIKDEPKITFQSIDKDEYQNLIAHFKQSGVRMRTVDLETNEKYDIEEGDIQNMQKESIKQIETSSGRRARKPAQDQQMGAEEFFDDDESEEDEDFEDNVGQDDDDEDGESDQYGSQDGDSDMIDAEVDKKELAHLKKENQAQQLPTKRTKREDSEK